MQTPSLSDPSFWLYDTIQCSASRQKSGVRELLVVPLIFSPTLVSDSIITRCFTESSSMGERLWCLEVMEKRNSPVLSTLSRHSSGSAHTSTFLFHPSSSKETRPQSRRRTSRGGVCLSQSRPISRSPVLAVASNCGAYFAVFPRALFSLLRLPFH